VRKGRRDCIPSFSWRLLTAFCSSYVEEEKKKTFIGHIYYGFGSFELPMDFTNESQPSAKLVEAF
jgi:hypothetical protein